MAEKKNVYDLSVSLKTLEGRPLTAKSMQLPMTWDEIQEYERQEEDEDEENEGGEEGKEAPAEKAKKKAKKISIPSFDTEPCSVVRLLRILIVQDEPQDPKAPLTKKKKEAIRADKEKRFELAQHLMQAMRNNTSDRVLLSKGDIEMFLDVTGVSLNTEIFGCVRHALTVPVVAADDDEGSSEE